MDPFTPEELALIRLAVGIASIAGEENHLTAARVLEKCRAAVEPAVEPEATDGK